MESLNYFQFCVVILSCCLKINKKKNFWLFVLVDCAMAKG